MEDQLNVSNFSYLKALFNITTRETYTICATFGLNPESSISENLMELAGINIDSLSYTEPTTVLNDTYIEDPFTAFDKADSEQKIQSLIEPGTSNSDPCAICQEIDGDGGDGGLVKLRCCEHHFHLNCITPWFKTAKLTCPVCGVLATSNRKVPTAPKKIKINIKCKHG